MKKLLIIIIIASTTLLSCTKDRDEKCIILSMSNDQDDLDKAFISGYCEWEMDPITNQPILDADGHAIPNN